MIDKPTKETIQNGTWIREVGLPWLGKQWLAKWDYTGWKKSTFLNLHSGRNPSSHLTVTEAQGNSVNLALFENVLHLECGIVVVDL